MFKSSEKRHNFSRDRLKQHLVLTKKLWIFLVLGGVVCVLGFIIGGIYINIRSITSSSEYTEIIPTYISSVLIVFTGVLIVSLVWRRYSVQVFIVIIVGIGTGTFCAAISILIGTHILPPLNSLELCEYSLSTSACVCFTPYRRAGLAIDYLETDRIRYNFISTSSCDVIQEVIPALLFTQLGLLLAVICLCGLTIVLSILVLRAERTRLHLLQEETYDEIFTVSGSSSVSDSDDDSHGKTHNSAVNDKKSTIAKTIDKGNGFPISILKATEGQSSLESSRSYARSNDSQRSNERLLRNLTSGIRKSRSCDSLDDIGSTNISDLSSDTLKVKKGQGKLKERRRKDKRAVTLHNLDTKELMIFLELHKTFNEETLKLKSQGNLNVEQEKSKSDKNQPLTSQRSQENLNIAQEKSKFDNRRALTPQPYTKQNTIPKIIRSHTPQPYHIQRKESFKKKDEKSEKNFKEEIKALFLKQSEMLKADIEKVKNKEHLKSGSKSVPGHKQLLDFNSNSVCDSEFHYNMNNKPKSRSSVQHHFLPSEPLRRRNADKLQLPPRPLTRQSSHKDTLPPQPIQRDGSAFYIVGSQLDLNQTGKGLKTPGELSCEKAIRDNFKLCKKSEENPYATPLKRGVRQTKSANDDPSVCHRNKRSGGQSSSENLPPYPSPPSYSDFVSISQDDSSIRTDSQSDNYDTVEHGKSESSDIQSESRDRLLTGSSDDDVFMSEHKKSVYNQVAKKRILPKMGVSADMWQHAARTNQQSSSNHPNHNHFYDSSNHYHVTSIANPTCVQTENPYHVPSNLYQFTPKISYHKPQNMNDGRLLSPFKTQHDSRYHFYEEIDNIETSFMYCEDMLPSTSSSGSQGPLLPCNKLTNGDQAFKPYRPITTLDANGETLETMI